MGSIRTLRRRKQRKSAKNRPEPRGPGFLTPKWIINDVLESFAKDIKIMEFLSKKY
jgi:hypothetical protein